MFGRHDDPRLGRNEVVRSVLIRFTRHLVLESGSTLLTACKGRNVLDRDVVGVKARRISCKQCQKWLNLNN